MHGPMGYFNPAVFARVKSCKRCISFFNFYSVRHKYLIYKTKLIYNNSVFKISLYLDLS